ncbi:MAG: threonine synthase [Sediminibacterium sp.]|nr:threonine synthase [Sediminibacterium sp.]
MKTVTQATTFVRDLQCAACFRSYSFTELQTYAGCCNQPLLVKYDYPRLSKKILADQPFNMWRYAPFLPVTDIANRVSLGEGWTPIHSLDKLADRLGLENVSLKDESTNPTGSFKARGLSVAISKAKELGIQHCIIPTAGNAGGALSAYAAKAGIKATVIMPSHTAQALKDECRLYGAELLLVDGLIDACGKKARQLAADTGALDMSTMKEPYRLEGKKTLGFEIAEQMEWRLPDVIIYPTGGGTGLIGMWKAFKEMQALGWIGGKLPRMVIVQAKNCDPMIQMFEQSFVPETFSPQPSIAYGLAVPHPFAKDLIQEAVTESNGTAVSVSEDEMIAGIREVAATEGLLLSPEGSATFMGLKKLIEKDYVKEDETVLLFNTGAWYKYR